MCLGTCRGWLGRFRSRKNRVSRAMVAALPLLVFGVFAVSAEVSSCSGINSDTMREDVSIINRFIAAVRCEVDGGSGAECGDIPSLDGIINFPLKRTYPLPGIKSAGEFRARYREVFDDEFIRIILNTEDHDCGRVGWRGLQMHSGLVWFAHTDTVVSINYESDVERRERIRLVEVERANLHPSLREYDYPVLEWETCRILTVGPRRFWMLISVNVGVRRLHRRTTAHVRECASSATERRRATRPVAVGPADSRCSRAGSGPRAPQGG